MTKEEFETTALLKTVGYGKLTPKAGDKYWYIGYDYHDDVFAGDPRVAIWSDHQMDENRFKLGNCFKDEKEAYAYRDMIYERNQKRLQVILDNTDD